MEEVTKPICEWVNDLVEQGNSQAERIAKLEEGGGGGSVEDIEELKKCCKYSKDKISELEKRIEGCGNIVKIQKLPRCGHDFDPLWDEIQLKVKVGDLVYVEEKQELWFCIYNGYPGSYMTLLKVATDKKCEWIGYPV